MPALALLWRMNLKRSAPIPASLVVPRPAYRQVISISIYLLDALAFVQCSATPCEGCVQAGESHMRTTRQAISVCDHFIQQHQAWYMSDQPCSFEEQKALTR